MAGWTPYSTDNAINTAYLKKKSDEEALDRCRKTYPDTQDYYKKCVPNDLYKKKGPTGFVFYDYTLEDWYKAARQSVPPRELCDMVADKARVNGNCFKLKVAADVSAGHLESLERAESQAASNRKNAIANANQQAKQLADDTAALPGLKRDELACNEISERTRCRQLRERIAGIERRLAGSANSQPTNSNNFANPTQAQPAIPPKPFTQPKPTSTALNSTPRKPVGRLVNNRRGVSRARGAAVIRAPRVSSASSS